MSAQGEALGEEAQHNLRCPPNSLGYLFIQCVSPLWGSDFIGMGAPTRGYAPGYHVSPLRGDRPARKPSCTPTQKKTI